MFFVTARSQTRQCWSPAARALSDITPFNGQWGGARVLSTVSSVEIASEARAAGADVTINYREEDVVTRVMDETSGEGADHICEVEFGGNIRTTEQIIKANGCVSIYAPKGELNPVMPMDVFMGRNIKAWPFMLPITPLNDRENAQADIATWIGEVKRIHRVAGEFPLAETVATHELVASKTKRGTVIVLPQE